MFDEILGWWRDLSPSAQAMIHQISVLLIALVAGHVLGAMVSRSLRNRNFDALLKFPQTPAPATVPSILNPAAAPEHGITPTFLAGWLVRLSVWGGAGCWFAHQFSRPDIADRIGLVLGRA